MDRHKSPVRAVFDEMYNMIAKRLNYDYYTHSPPDNTPYPFVRFVQCTNDLVPTKEVALENVTFFCDVWTEGNNAGQALEMIEKIKSQAMQLNQIGNYRVKPELPNFNQNLVAQKAKNDDPLYQGIVIVKFLVY